jgi:nitroimidazol reductase NimA-like FMN-containing flavoprotein (pyridoxamine 5'-phosphate oxidase superfamily)
MFRGLCETVRCVPGLTSSVHTDPIEQPIHQLLSVQLQGVMATQQDAQPYTSLMAFAHTDDLRYLVFATFRETQKHANLMSNALVSFLIDDRSNDPGDYQRATALSVFGRAVAIVAGERAAYLSLFLDKHPGLKDFVGSPDCVLMRVEVSCYRLVSEFQTVRVLRMESPAVT